MPLPKCQCQLINILPLRKSCVNEIAKLLFNQSCLHNLMSESDYVSPSNIFLKMLWFLDYLKMAVVPFGQRVKSDVLKSPDVLPHYLLSI